MKELERLETEASIARGEADILAGRVLTEDEFNASMDRKLEELRGRTGA